jgi:hypothetical protein
MEDPDSIFKEEGAMAAFLEARLKGKMRFIGFTGHKDPLIHLRMLQVTKENDFHFDTVQMPINVVDAHFRSFSAQVLPVLLREKIAPLAMKTFGDHFILDTKTADPVRNAAFFHELASGGGDHGYRQAGNPRSGIGGRENLSAHGQSRCGFAAWKNACSREQGRIGVVQNHLALRRHGTKS